MHAIYLSTEKSSAKRPAALLNRRSEAPGHRNPSTTSLSFGLGPGRDLRLFLAHEANRCSMAWGLMAFCFSMTLYKIIFFKKSLPKGNSLCGYGNRKLKSLKDSTNKEMGNLKKIQNPALRFIGAHAFSPRSDTHVLAHTDTAGVTLKLKAQTLFQVYMFYVDYTLQQLNNMLPPIPITVKR